MYRADRTDNVSYLMTSSVIFPVCSLGRRFPYNCNSVWRSAFVPNLAKSEFRIVTSLLPGSFITDVYLSDFTTEEPGASTSYSPSRLFFDRFVRGLFLPSFESERLQFVVLAVQSRGGRSLWVLCLGPHSSVLLRPCLTVLC